MSRKKRAVIKTAVKLALIALVLWFAGHHFSDILAGIIASYIYDTIKRRKR